MSPQTLVALVLGGVTIAMGTPIAMQLAGVQTGFLAKLGFRSGPRGNVSAWTAAIVLAIAYAAFSISRIPEVARHWHEISWLKAEAIVAAVAAGVVEEAVFRRLLMDAIAKAGGNAALQIAASAVAFGLAHGTWGLLGGSLHAAIGAAIATTILGAALGVIYIAGRRSLAPCIAAHFLIDAVIEPGLLLSAVRGFGG
jgi:CAAX protease family protein